MPFATCTKDKVKYYLSDPSYEPLIMDWASLPVPETGEPPDSRGWPGPVNTTPVRDRDIAYQLFYRRTISGGLPFIETSCRLVIGFTNGKILKDDQGRFIEYEPVSDKASGLVESHLERLSPCVFAYRKITWL